MSTKSPKHTNLSSSHQQNIITENIAIYSDLLHITGAFMFQYIEEPQNIEESSMVSKRRNAVMQMWNITDR